MPGYETWTNNMHKYLKQRYFDGENAGEKCTPGDDRDAFARHRNKPCNFDTSVLGDCSKKPFGYDAGQPCVFLKLNRLYNVKNEPYDGDCGNATVSEGDCGFPKKMPAELVQHIKTQKDRNQVWIDCHGENPADIEALGPIEYFPKSRGFPEYYFPYLNQVSACSNLGKHADPPMGKDSCANLKLQKIVIRLGSRSHLP